MILVLGAALRVDAATASWDRNPETTVTGYRLSYGTQSGSHPASIDVGNVITYQFFPPAGQRYYVVVQAYDSTGALSAKSAEAFVDIPATTVNQAPTFTQPANQASVQNTAVSLALVASDPDGTAVTFAATGLPPGLSLNAAAGVIAGTVTTVGTYSVIATASDGALFTSRAFAWIVTAPNQAPTFTQPANQTSVQNTTVSLALVASDPNGTPVAFSATGLPPGVTLNASTGVIAGTVTTVGTYSVTATASDGSLTASRSFTWTVAAANQAPTLTQPVNQTSVRNTAVSLALIASDPNGTAVTFSATGLPPGVSLDASTGAIAGTVTTVGTYSVTATASDGSLTASSAFTWTVDSPGSIALTLAPADTFINIDGTNFSTEPSLNTYTYPANRIANTILMKFDISQIPANAIISSAALQLALVDADGATADPTYSVSLHQIINRNPDITRATGMMADSVTAWTANTCCYNNIPMAQSDLSPAPSVTAVDRALGFRAWDARSIVEAWRNAPATNYGLALNSDATKGADRYRSFASTEHASPAQRPYLRITYTLPVSTADVTPPTVNLRAPANHATVSGSSVAVAASASDNVAVVGVQFRLDGANIGIEDVTPPFSISWNSTTATNGTHRLTAVARDAAGNIATSSGRTITVSNTAPNRAPALTQPANQTGAEGDVVSLALIASDPDGNRLTFGASGLPGGLAVNATTGLIAGTLRANSAGVYAVTVTASDGSLTASRIFAWSVGTTDLPLQGDFDGDGREDPATYRATTGEWRLWPSTNHFAAATPIVWGSGSDVPIPADYDGDRKTDIAVYRPSTGTWHVLLSTTNMQTSLDIQWGSSSDRPLPIDYDGDGRADLALPRFGGFEILLSGTNYLTSVTIQ